MPDSESGREDRTILTFKVNFLCQKSSESFQIFFSLKNIKSGAQLLLMTLFAYCHFWSTLFTKIGPKLQTLIPNLALICQRPFKVRKWVKVLISIHLTQGLMRSCWKNLKWYLIYICYKAMQVGSNPLFMDSMMWHFCMFHDISLSFFFSLSYSVWILHCSFVAYTLSQLRDFGDMIEHACC